MRSRILTTIILLMPIPLAILGAMTRETWFIYAMILVVAGIVGLIACTEIVPKSLYPLAIFSIGLALLYQTTLISPYLVGTDIHSEYYYYQEALGGWDRTIPGNYNTAIGVVLLAPFLTNVFHIDGVWIFKVIYPFIFSLAPVLLYLAYKELIGHKQAFLASFFFISVPTFMLEVIGITKLQLSGFCLAFVVFLLFYEKWSPKLRLSLAIPASILLIMSHYSTGYVYLYFIGASAVLVLIAKLLKLGVPRLPVKALFMMVGVIAAGIICYFGLIGSNLVDPTVWVEPAKYIPPPSAQIMSQQEPVIHTALGLDFLGATAEGKMFRILQILTEVFIIGGFIAVILRARRQREFPLEYTALCGAGMLLLAACVFLPEFSKLLNMTRFYHLALYFIAPLFIIGGIYILKPILKQRVLPVIALGILIPYFIFTSGFVFEAMRKTDISRVDIPYSIALSSSRLDIAAVCTDEDWGVLQWASKSGAKNLIYADIHGTFLMREWVGIEDENRIAYLPVDVSQVPDDGWVFLRKWNGDNKAITYHAGIGLRKSVGYSELGIGALLEGREVLYRNSQACIYGSKDH